MSKPEMEFVESANLRAVGYHEDSLELWVEFNDDSTYIYDGVPAVVHAEMMEAPSKGSYLNRVIKGTFGFRKA